MIDMIGMLYAAWRQNLECGDKSRAVRGSRHRFLSAPYAETHLVSTPSRLPQRRSVGTKRNRRSVSTKRALRFLVLSTDLRRFFFFVFDRRMGGTSVCSSAGKQTLAPPGAPRAQIPRTGISIGLSQQCGRPRPQQRVLQKAGAHTCSVSDFIFDMVDMIDMIDTIWTSRLPRIARRESGAATRAQRGSCHRTPNFSATPCAAQQSC